MAAPRVLGLGQETLHARGALSARAALQDTPGHLQGQGLGVSGSYSSAQGHISHFTISLGVNFYCLWCSSCVVLVGRALTRVLLFP